MTGVDLAKKWAERRGSFYLGRYSRGREGKKHGHRNKATVNKAQRDKNGRQKKGRLLVLLLVRVRGKDLVP